jgi:hypothetical protein
MRFKKEKEFIEEYKKLGPYTHLAQIPKLLCSRDFKSCKKFIDSSTNLAEKVFKHETEKDTFEIIKDVFESVIELTEKRIIKSTLIDE